MKYTDLIFDLYGTLVDIHTEENDLVWEKTAIFFGFYGAHYSGPELQLAFREELAAREAKAGQSYECFPDIPFETVMDALFLRKGIDPAPLSLGVRAGQLFRICSIEYICLYPHVPEVLAQLRRNGCRLWLLSNAQRIFTAFELQYLQLDQYFDGIYISSDFQCRKPDVRFFRALLEERELNPESCLMIGNDLHTDIGGAKAAGLDTLYMHTNLTPPDQRTADPALHPDFAESGTGHYEYEGSDWQDLCRILASM